MILKTTASIYTLEKVLQTSPSLFKKSRAKLGDDTFRRKCRNRCLESGEGLHQPISKFVKL